MSNRSYGATVDQRFLDVDQILLDPAVQARESSDQDGKLQPATMPRTPLCEGLPRRLDNISVEERRELCTLWWDQLAKYVVLFTAAGWDPQQIADFLGMSVEEDILPILKPCPPIREVAEFKDISSKPEMLATAYRKVVDHIIHFLLENCYMRAGSCAADEEGFSELKTALAECERYHGDRVKKLMQFVCPLAHAKAYWPQFTFAQSCACMDARFALGIEKNPDLIRQTKQPLAERFQDHLRQMDADGLAT